MKYKIVVEKLEESKYFAYCANSHILKGIGSDVSSAMHNLRDAFVCNIHDPEMEIEIVLNRKHVDPDPFLLFDLMERK